MNLALLALLDVFTPLQTLVRWLGTALTPSAHPAGASAPRESAVAPKRIAFHAINTRPGGQSENYQKPLRVVRILEAGQARTSVGRMVISGRMADVCAELDRLAAREAALS